jgi:hypothetical protein
VNPIARTQGDSMVRLIVEHAYDSPLTDEEHHRAARRLDPCLEAHGARWLASYLAHDRLRMICEFEAPDAESVRASMRSADVSFVRVWSTEVYRLNEPDVK